MPDRTILGFRADARETAEATLADPKSVERIISSLDGEPSGADGDAHATVRRLKHRLIELTRYHLGDPCARVANAILSGRDWRKLHMAKPTFYQRKKKVENFFKSRKHRAKRLLRGSPRPRGID